MQLPPLLQTTGTTIFSTVLEPLLPGRKTIQAGKTLLRLQQSKCAKIFALPGVVPHFNAIREMVKNSATDWRSMSMMDATLDLDKLVSSMAFRTDAHECQSRSVPKTVRALKAIVKRVRGMEANSSSHFQDAHASELQAFNAKCASTLVALRGVQVKHFWSGAAVALKSFCGAVTNTLNEDSFVAITESLASTPLVSSLSSAAVSGTSAFMDENAAKVHGSVLEMMLDLKKGSKKSLRFRAAMTAGMARVVQPRLCFIQCWPLKSSPSHPIDLQPCLPPSRFGEDTVWPTSAALAKADFSKALRLKVWRSGAHEVKTTHFTSHSYLQALFKKQNVDSDTFLLNNSLGLLPDEFFADAQAFGEANKPRCNSIPKLTRSRVALSASGWTRRG